MESLSDYTTALQRKANREIAWSVLGKRFSGSAPRRFVSGVAVSSAQPNANGQSFDARGGVALELPMPLLWQHDWCRAIGKVTDVSVRGDEVRFTAELCNGGLSAADEVWSGLVNRLQHGVSIGPFKLHDDDGRGGHFHRWGLEEISMAPSGADPGGRIVRVWEKLHVVSLRKPAITEHWSADA
jgi:hypothetical protein